MVGEAEADAGIERPEAAVKGCWVGERVDRFDVGHFHFMIRQRLTPSATLKHASHSELPVEDVVQSRIAK